VLLFNSSTGENIMKHKWHKEIKAWFDGAEIEVCKAGTWYGIDYPNWNFADEQYRIKPQPKEPQYLYVSQGNDGKPELSFIDHQESIGKIKLDSDNA
jgi:hypothetical protein